MENEIIFIKLDDIIPNRFQPREVFEEESLQKLADSIRRHGVIEPILVRPISNKFEIIAGERRYKASVLAGLTKIPAIVKQMDDKESSIVAYIENEHRNNVSAIEEARTIDRILKSNDITQEELARELGINQSTLANKLRLLTLPLEIQESLMHNEISERHARSLLSVKDEAKQIELLRKIKEKRMTVRELDSEIKNMNNYSINNMQAAEMNNLFDGNLNNYDNNNPLPTNEPLNTEAYLNNVDSIEQPINTNETLNNQLPTEEIVNSDFINYLNNYDNSNSLPTNEPLNTETYLNNVDSTNQPVNNEIYLNGEISTEKTENSDFMNYLNNYDNNNPLPTNESLNTEAYLNNVDSMEQSININENLNNQPQIEEPQSNDFMNYLNNYDNNNSLSTNEPLNNETYLNSEISTEQPIDNDYYNEPIDNNVIINNVNPPITSNFNNNTYIENTENYVDVSKNNFINNFDEIINKLKVVVDDIKSNSSFKIDTDEINYDDMYQITIKIDKRDF